MSPPQTASQAVARGVADVFALMLVLGFLVWFITGCLAEASRRRWGFFCRRCQHRHYGEAFQYRCSGLALDDDACECPEVYG